MARGRRHKAKSEKRQSNAAGRPRDEHGRFLKAGAVAEQAAPAPPKVKLPPREGIEGAPESIDPFAIIDARPKRDRAIVPKAFKKRGFYGG